MKKCYIITFDLKNSGFNQENIRKAIKSLGGWARISENTYLVSTFSSAVQIRDYILKLMYQGDKIYVTHLEKESAWYGLGDDISTWIRNNQT